MAVKAPADKRFKRGRVKTPRKAARRWTALIRPLVKWTLVLGILGYTTVRALALVTESPALRISHVAVQGQRHLSAGDVRARVRMLEGANIVRADLERGAPPAARLAVDRRRDAAPSAAGDDRDRDRGARSRWRWRASPAAACS